MITPEGTKLMIDILTAHLAARTRIMASVLPRRRTRSRADARRNREGGKAAGKKERRIPVFGCIVYISVSRCEVFRGG